MIVVITDDKRAKNTCRELGIKVIGTLGLIEFAKKHGAISKEEALSLIAKIPYTSLYITQELLEKAQNKIKHQQTSANT
jgi:predicted nucleic acid-binding protein